MDTSVEVREYSFSREARATWCVLLYFPFITESRLLQAARADSDVPFLLVSMKHLSRHPSPRHTFAETLGWRAQIRT